MTLTEIVDKIQDCDWDGIHTLSKEEATQLIQSYCDQENKKLRSLAEKVVEANNEYYAKEWKHEYCRTCIIESWPMIIK